MAARRYHFDHWGRCLGYLDDDGHYYDKSGECRGEVVGGRDLYDVEGTFRGHFDIQGQYWDEDGKYCGYLRTPLLPPSKPAELVSRREPGSVSPAVPKKTEDADLSDHKRP